MEQDASRGRGGASLTPEEKTALNRRIAESLGWKISDSQGGRDICPDYFSSEEHSALIFEAMPFPDLYQDPDTKMWFCFFIPPPAGDAEYFDVDRKTAIVKAYCGFIGVSYAKV